MRIKHGKEGTLTIALGEESEWEIFHLLLTDAAGRGDDWLAKQMGLFVNDEDWDEFAVPEVTNHYNGQIETVSQEVAQAYAKAADGVGEVPVTRATGEAWYGVLNQARLGLEGRWKLAAAEDAGEFETGLEGDLEKSAAYYRSRLYCYFQVQLIESVLD